MAFADYFYEFKKKFDGTDVSDIKEHLAYQFNLEGEETGGSFYVEVKEGVLHIEPYEYYDRDAAFTCTPDILDQIIAGKLDAVDAFSAQQLKVDGDLEKALRLKELIAKKAEQAAKGAKKTKK
ncbi:MAG: SCP2 sterol-binding domain-containing protein [Butyrivibrio sp.]|nr:SCP2 sterol-binding domain-containing protein [Muribaculum sp.]MCM1551727.1 SCP2 sterol-binding domain-containing protein [Butyrivibrio sp.]